MSLRRFTPGDTPPLVIERVRAVRRDAPMMVERGYDNCELCAARAYDPVTNERLGNIQIWIPSAGGTWFVSPDPVNHYMANHGYCPPSAYIDATMAAVPSRIRRARPERLYLAELRRPLRSHGMSDKDRTSEANE